MLVPLASYTPSGVSWLAFIPPGPIFIFPCRWSLSILPFGPHYYGGFAFCRPLRFSNCSTPHCWYPPESLPESTPCGSIRYRRCLASKPQCRIGSNHKAERKAFREGLRRANRKDSSCIPDRYFKFSAWWNLSRLPIARSDNYSILLSFLYFFFSLFNDDLMTYRKSFFSSFYNPVPPCSFLFFS